MALKLGDRQQTHDTVSCFNVSSYSEYSPRVLLLYHQFENPKPVRQKPLKLFLKIAQNVLANPGEAKFRRLNAMKIVPKLSACDGSVDLLEATGFKGDGESHYVLVSDF